MTIKQLETLSRKYNRAADNLNTIFESLSALGGKLLQKGQITTSDWETFTDKLLTTNDRWIETNQHVSEAAEFLDNAMRRHARGNVVPMWPRRKR